MLHPLFQTQRDEMSHFLTWVLDYLVEECHSPMLHDNINIYRLMVNAQQVIESRLRRKNRKAKKARSFEGGSS